MKLSIMKSAIQWFHSTVRPSSGRSQAVQLREPGFILWSRPQPTLVVNRDLVAAKNLADKLVERGYGIDIVNNYLAAQIALRAKYYRSIIFVIEPDDRSGWDDLGRLRARVPGSWIIVVTSASHDEHDMQDKVFRLGGDSLLVTPFAFENLDFRLSAFSLRSRPF